MNDADEIKSLREKCQQLNESERKLKEALHGILTVASANRGPDIAGQVKKLAEDALGVVTG